MSQPLHRLLLVWYDGHKRAMPWRGHPDPYAVWVSEIMLQQTQVETVRGYFARFIGAFPTVADLASAPQQQVLKMWEGLGYYTRARNLQKAAQAVVAQGGVLPETAEGWAALPGVGPYTAAAIASICFGAEAPVVDGNVMRVFARFLGWPDDFRKAQARVKLATWLRPHIVLSRRPGDFNQAMMDLGAMVCVPREPVCDECPLRADCVARRECRQDDFPVRPVKKAVPTRQAVAVLVRDEAGRVLFSQRTEEGLLCGLWELPGIGVTRRPTRRDALRALRETTGLSSACVEALGTVTHVFSHFKLILHVYVARAYEGSLDHARRPPVRFSVPSELPLTTAARRALDLA
ncbi:MAG TPA: A/G-specific adenine glycosylase [Kiritimatiellia bacterium]|nr:A/G-specific adenine glycosylase [Kiritimatiellia bacterium]HPS08583.1 A/G-specific adenine glycosylase [Kiritimatiellia bacterium]